MSREILLAEYKQLVNHTLPATYTAPVRFNHCFGRIILDWLFQDCWYRYLHRREPAVHQLTEVQLQAAISRMHAWLHDRQLLVADNNASLEFRRKARQKQD